MRGDGDRAGALPAVHARDPFDAQWHIYVSGQTYGPFTGHELRDMAREGRISETDLVSADHGATWIEIDAQPILRRLFPKEADEAPQKFTAAKGRRINAIAGVVVLALLGWMAWPYITLYSLGVAVRDGDVSSLESLINWEGVRQGLRGDFNAMILKKSAAEKDDFGKGLAMVFGPTLVNQMVDGYVTPQAFASLVRTGKPANAAAVNASNNTKVPAAGQFDFKQLRYAFFNGGPFAFRVDVLPKGSATSAVVRLDFKWSGKWQVDRLVLPLDEIDAIDQRTKPKVEAAVAYQAPDQSTKTSMPLNRAVTTTNVATWGAMFKSQVERCWKKPYGGAEAAGTQAVFNVRLNRDGSLNEKPTVVGGAMDSVYGRSYRDSALRAIVACAPYSLPVAYYDEWKWFEPVFSERRS